MYGQWLHTNKKMYADLRKWLPKLHETGAKLFVQLTAGFGRSFAITPMMEKLWENKALRVASKPVMDLDMITASASASPNRWSDKVPSRALTVKEIERYIREFAVCSRMLMEAGVDGVEVHAVHEGYLLDQFAMANMNHRTDEYGGSLENRLRFACEIIRAIKAACGEDYPVSVRYSVASKIRGFNQGALPGENYVEFGRSMEESPAAARILESAGADLLNADNGSYDSWFWAHPPVYMPMACNLPEVSYLKQFVNIPVACAGRMNDPEIAADAVETGKVDAVGIARQLLADFEWCDKVRQERLEDIRPCIACHNGCFAISHFKGNPCGFGSMGNCALNPVTLHETELELKPAEKPKKVAVIGGGIGGMETAIQASLRGHKVDLYEKTDRLGGVFCAAAAMSFKEKDKELLEWYRRKLAECGAKVHMNTEVENLKALDADTVVIATGAHAKTLPIPGADKAVTAAAFLNGEAKVGENVAIIGGGLTGCEIAYELALQGKRPFIVEMTPYLVGAKGICMANSTMLRELLRYHGVPAYLNAAVQEITDEGVTISTPEGQKTVPADSVILSVGYAPDTRFAALKGKKNRAKGAKDVYFVGDCDKVGSLKTVIKQAYELVQTLSYE
jgi:2-enoate reductase